MVDAPALRANRRGGQDFRGAVNWPAASRVYQACRLSRLV
jgi:hypothetical protein